MAETPSQQPTTAQAPAPTPSVSESDPLEYWCYQCNKQVSVETIADLPDVICRECKNGFVESIPAATPPVSSRTSDEADEPSFGDQFLQVLRLITQAAREDNSPPPPPSEHADPTSDDDYLRIEFDGWDNDDDDEEEEDANSVEVRNEEEVQGQGQEGEGEDRARSDDQNAENENREGRDEEDLLRRRRDVFHLRLRDFIARAGGNRRYQILDWADILMGLEDHSIEFRLQVPEVDDYVGNPGDYVDAAGYEALLQNLADSDGGGRRGAPPAAKSALLALETLEIKSEDEILACAICKDSVNTGDVAKKLPCGHGYHGHCIVPWLGSRNSCPVCRFELPTDDHEYEEERKKRSMAMGSGAPASSSGDISGFD